MVSTLRSPVHDRQCRRPCPRRPAELHTPSISLARASLPSQPARASHGRTSHHDTSRLPGCVPVTSSPRTTKAVLRVTRNASISLRLSLRDCIHGPLVVSPGHVSPQGLEIHVPSATHMSTTRYRMATYRRGTEARQAPFFGSLQPLARPCRPWRRLTGNPQGPERLYAVELPEIQV